MGFSAIASKGSLGRKTLSTAAITKKKEPRPNMVKKFFDDVSNIPVIGSLVNATGIPSLVNTVNSAFRGDIKDTLKSGLGLLPGIAGKIGGAVAEFIPGSNDQQQDVQDFPTDEERNAHIQEVVQEHLKEQRDLTERLRTDPVFKAERKAMIRKRKDEQIAGQGQSANVNAMLNKFSGGDNPLLQGIMIGKSGGGRGGRIFN